MKTKNLTAQEKNILKRYIISEYEASEALDESIYEYGENSPKTNEAQEDYDYFSKSLRDYVSKLSKKYGITTRQIHEIGDDLINNKMEKGNKMKTGGNLKPIPAGNKGLPKLPEEVRNRMGYMEKGGGVENLTIGSEIVGSKKMYFIYNGKSGKKSKYYNSKEDAQKELNKMLRVRKMAEGGEAEDKMKKGGPVKKSKGPKRSKKNLDLDAKIKAKPPGKRISDGEHYPYEKGNVYYEYSPNRSDVSRKKKPYLEKGGMTHVSYGYYTIGGL